MSNPGKQRQMLRITWLNLLLGVVLMIVFTVSTLTLSSSLREERDGRTARTLEHFSESFLSETTHLRDVMSLSKSNANLTMLTANSYTEWSDISDYAMQAISVLNITQKSLTNVIRLIFVSPSVGRAFSGDGTILLPISQNAGWLTSRLAPGESVDDFETLSIGWHSYRNFALYVQRGYNNSSLIAVVNTSHIADLDTFNKSQPDQHIIVLDSDGNYFTSSFNTSRYTVETDSAYASLQSGDGYSFMDVDYVVSRLDTDSFSFLLLTDRQTAEQSYRSINIAIVTVVAVTLMLLTLTLLNTVYFGKVSRLIPLRGSGRSDIEQLSQIMQERASYHRAEIERLIAAAASRRATDEDYASIGDTISEEFERYFVISIAVQNARVPLSTDLFSQLYQYLNDHFVCFGAQTAEGQMTFLAERSAGAEHLYDILFQFFDSMAIDGRAWVGVSTSYVDPSSLKRAFEQALARRLSLPLKADTRLICSDTTVARRSTFVVNPDQIEQIADAALEGDADHTEALLNQCLYTDPPCTLSDMQYVAELITACLDKHLPGNAEDYAGLTAFSPESIFHPARLVDALLIYAHGVHELCEAAPVINAPPASSNAVVKWIEEHYAEDISLESVAEQFHITPVHLSRWFKKENDINFSTFLAALRITHARELLDADPSIRNADLAERVGMASVLTFTRQFKAQTGMTPDQYRKACRG